MKTPTIQKNKKQEEPSSFLVWVIEALLEAGTAFIVDGKIFVLHPEEKPETEGEE